MMSARSTAVLCLILFLACLARVPHSTAQQEEDPGEVVGEFLLLLLGSQEGRQQALDFVQEQWQPGFTPMLLEVLTFSEDPAFAAQLVALLERKTGRSLGFNISQWQQWLWNQEPLQHPQ